MKKLVKEFFKNIAISLFLIFLSILCLFLGFETIMKILIKYNNKKNETEDI